MYGRGVVIGAAVTAAALVGCAVNRAAEGARRDGGSDRVLTCEEILAGGAEDAFEVVRRLRPVWLQTRGAVSFHFEPEIGFVLDGSPAGGISNLQGMSATTVRSMRRLNAEDAKIYGQYVHGVIEVTTGHCERAPSRGEGERPRAAPAGAPAGTDTRAG